MEKNKIRLVFCVKDAFADGGMPNDIRHFLEGNLKNNQLPITLITNSGKEHRFEELNDLEIIPAYSIKDILKLKFKVSTNDLFFIFIGYSSLYNFILSYKLGIEGFKYAIIPSWQIHPFLDLDNPFEKSTVPSIDNVLKKQHDSNGVVFRRVRNGDLNFYSYLNKLKRKLIRISLGKIFIQNAKKIFVFSNHEKNHIHSFFNLNKNQFGYIHFGTKPEHFKIGKDRFGNTDETINIVFWGRVDYYYKGIDTMLTAIAMAKANGIEKEFKLWIIGPDYSGGYAKVNRKVSDLNISNYVRLLSPGEYESGTIGFLRTADFSIASPRWDGFSRSLRESLCLGVPIITNRETHFDLILEKFQNGLVFENEKELSEIFQDLGSDKALMARKNARVRQEECKEYFSWVQAANLFQKQIIQSR